MERKNKKKLAIISICLMIFTILAAVTFFVLSSEYSSNLFEGKTQTETEIESQGVNASDPESLSRSPWELTNNSTYWDSTPDAIEATKNNVDNIDPKDEGIKNKAESLDSEAKPESTFSEQTWNVTGNFKEWLNITDELDDLKHQLSNGDGELADEMQQLFHCENNLIYLSGGKQAVPGTHIQADKSAIFVVAYEIFNYDNQDYNLWLYSGSSSESSDVVISKVRTDDFKERRLFIFPSTEILLFLEDINSSTGGWEINYEIMVQGTPDTTITHLNPP